jgi:hypothetical protein
MPLKLRAARRPHGLDDYRLSELFSLRRPLIALNGYAGDEAAIAAAWARLERPLVELWISGWKPAVKFVVSEAEEPGAPGTRPAGWWRYCAPEPRGKRESEMAYLRRKGLLIDGEQELLAAHARRAATESVLLPAEVSRHRDN